ncbi:hypothetical protein PC123_g1486 [Phytophthora cactorum]|nr:hypothetical protein PC123_g1486 [Phytophthora cactorum]
MDDKGSQQLPDGSGGVDSDISSTAPSPGSRRRCATHKDVGGDANVNANLGSNGVLANFQLAAGQLEVHASGGRSRTRSSCISSSNMTETRMSTCSTASREGRDQ